MADDTTIAKLLAELDSIANAAMTAEQRLTRAQPILTTTGLSVADLTQALARVDLPWNVSKAAECGVSADQWQQALDLASVGESTDLSALLDAVHRAESAAAMLKSGYRGTRDASGNLAWAR